MEVSRVLGPLNAETERGLVLLVHVELDALAAVSVPWTLFVGTLAVLFDATHEHVSHSNNKNVQQDTYLP